MKYWHIQLHPNDQSEIGRAEVVKILRDTGYIGVGSEWDNGDSQVRQFSEEVQLGDVVLVRSNGPLALVQIIGQLEYDEQSRDRLDWFENRRKVKVLAWHDERLKSKLGRNSVDGIFAPISFAPASKSKFIKAWHQLTMREEKQNQVASLLKAKGQIILQGPPGTGKTWLAERVAAQLAAADDVKLVQFHPAYAYEDFVRGIVAETGDGDGLRYSAENKILADFAKQAVAAPTRNFVLIIDEINRANLPSVLGELIYALEYRGKRVESVYGLGETKDRGLVIPSNMLIIGTMNTSDRSVGHLDYAIRRRFAFVSVLPEAAIIEDEAGRGLFEQVAALFTKEYLAPEFEPEQVQPGHSYFMIKADEGLTLAQKLKYEIEPLLQEYLRDGVLRPKAKEIIAQLTA